MMSACERTATIGGLRSGPNRPVNGVSLTRARLFPGICSVHRAELKRLRGSLKEAERECRQVCADPRGYVETAAAAFYEIGEIRLRRGDYDGAEEAFREAHERGRDPVPGLRSFSFSRGSGMLPGVDHTSSGGSQLPLDRARLLPSQIRIALAAADFEAARPSIEELELIASQYEAAALHAAGAHARGSLDLAQQNFEEASKNFRRALELWLEVDLPYEAAMTRVLLAQCYRGLGDEASADLEFRAARSAFERLGAQGADEFGTLVGSG